MIFIDIFVSSTCLLAIDKLSKLKDDNLRYNLLHLFVDFFISIIAAEDAWDVFSNPIQSFNKDWSNSYGQALLISLLVYHYIRFKQMCMFDKIHHSTALIFGLLPSYFFIQTKGVNTILFIFNRPLGVINLIILDFYLKKKITSYTHSLISLVLFVWLRAPLIIVFLYEWCRSISRGESHPVTIILIFAGIINTITISHLTVIRFYKKYVQKEQQKKNIQNKQMILRNKSQ